MSVFVRIFIALAVVAGLSSCSGAVSGPVPVSDPTKITILPGMGTDASGAPISVPVTAYSGLPTTFTVTGGTGSYIVSSSNQAIIAISGPISGTTFTVVPSPVVTSTTVMITARDTGTAAPATVTVTVLPGTVNNEVTVTPTSSAAAACAPAICSGGDALVSVTISQGGIPLAARGVRFDVLSGTFSFVSTDPVTHVVTLVNTIQVVTDETGKAVALIRIPANAQNQTALLQVTDIGTGTFQRTSFVIVQSTGSSPGFFVAPTQITFQGAQQNECANFGISASVFVFGGVPPYTVSNSGPFQVSPNFISSSGGSYSVTPNGSCVAAPGLPIVVTDSSGHTATTTVENIPGTTAPPALTAQPAKVTLSSCTGSASVTVGGGAPGPGGYFASAGSNAITASVSGNTVTILRANPSPATAGPVNVGISDGITTTSVEVDLVGQGAGTCPATGFAASSTAVVLNDCTGVTQVALSGGSGTYSASSDNTGVTATVSGNVLSIKRTNPSGAFTGSATVTATDGISSVPITVTGSGPGAGACSGTPTAFAASPTSVTLSACTDVAAVVLSGGSGFYSAVSGNTSVTVFTGGNILSISRTSSTPSGTPTTVTATDGVSVIPIAVSVVGAALGPC